jgi:ribosomal protein S18 acetylase RimI-like enzyme
MQPETIIRAARVEDAKGIATVQMRTWQVAYADIFPADKLAGLNQELETRIERWGSIVSGAERLAVTYVAEQDGQVIGFVNAGRQVKVDHPQDAELFAIYILPDFHGKGIGRKLVSAAAAELKTLGFTSLLLWVLADNQASRGFYERLGGTLCGEDEYIRWEKSYPLAAYCYDDLDALIQT